MAGIKLVGKPGDGYIAYHDITRQVREKDIHDETEQLKKDLAERYKHHENSSSNQLKSDFAEYYKYYKSIELPVPQAWQEQLDLAKWKGWISEGRRGVSP